MPILYRDYCLHYCWSSSPRYSSTPSQYLIETVFYIHIFQSQYIIRQRLYLPIVGLRLCTWSIPCCHLHILPIPHPISYIHPNWRGSHRKTKKGCLLKIVKITRKMVLEKIKQRRGSCQQIWNRFKTGQQFSHFSCFYFSHEFLIDHHRNDTRIYILMETRLGRLSCYALYGRCRFRIYALLWWLRR